MRLFLWAGAIGFGVWELTGALLWIHDAGSVGTAAAQTWDRLSSDWFLLIVVTDHLVIAGVALLWVLSDSARRGWSVGKRLALVAVFIGLGTPALLGYLAQRRSPELQDRA